MTRPRSPRLALLAAGALVAACGGAADAWTAQADELASTNGMSTNGMSTNGMSTNGMSTNGISTNGVTTNAALFGPSVPGNGLGPGGSGLGNHGLTNAFLTQASFKTWFEKDPPYSDMVMRYLVRCAVAAGQTRSYTGASGSHTWSGLLGVAPGWAGGAAPGVLEQQLVSACMGAHANRFGLHVPFSVQGPRGDGTLIPVASDENTTYAIPEGSFFGNLFNSAGIFSCSEGTTGTAGMSGPRMCAVSTQPGDVCAPLVNTQKACWQLCTWGNNGYYNGCTVGGVTYAPLVTRIASSDVYWCGDSVCQFTESCYDAATGTGCLADCGRCP